MNQGNITEETALTYRRIITFYEDLIALKSKNINEND